MESMALDVLAKLVLLVCSAKKTSTNVFKCPAEMVCENIGIIKRTIHLIPKWRPINYSFVCMLISP